MKIETKYQGIVEVAEDRFITFEKGLPAFEEETSFVLLPFEENTPFYVLQSTKSANVAFIVVNPFDYVAQYEVKLTDSTIEQLEIVKQEDVAIFVMLTIREPFAETTANLQGPVVINAAKQKGKQILMNETNYQTKHAIFAAAKGAK
ncbi:flagellar assembly protein FliW [Alkalihalobacillus oceani]|uniref:Flagellar assembly factor FliW n=1 Tax=Halalkalibacter oceani TaxID=1653776 RepID=A0A9X2DR57_9BACI|nr:flagellar assembly protein FliW [Halalkalibacter oceani]MCM3714660.1 flagellar assembly protein FliW [Halalkalibacter oceani]